MKKNKKFKKSKKSKVLKGCHLENLPKPEEEMPLPEVEISNISGVTDDGRNWNYCP